MTGEYQTFCAETFYIQPQQKDGYYHVSTVPHILRTLQEAGIIAISYYDFRAKWFQLTSRCG